MSRTMNLLKKIILFLSPFHNSKIITHDSLQRKYKLQSANLPSKAQQNLKQRYKEIVSKNGHFISEEDGFLITEMKNKKLLQNAIDYCRTAWPKDYIEATVSKPSKNDTLLPIHIDVRDKRNNLIRELVGCDEIVSTVAKYLGEPPVLYGAYVWYCPNRDADGMVGSQLFHCDREDYRQMKIFIPIDEITADSGPTTCIPASNTQHFFDQRKKNGLSLSLKNRFTDDEVHNNGSEQEHAIIGQQGILGFVDTTNCLHYGSRPAKSGKYHIVLHYLSPFSSKLRSQLDPSQFEEDTAEEILTSFRDESHYLREPMS